jgi:hypothetical protein
MYQWPTLEESLTTKTNLHVLHVIYHFLFLAFVTLLSFLITLTFRNAMVNMLSTRSNLEGE